MVEKITITRGPTLARTLEENTNEPSNTAPVALPLIVVVNKFYSSAHSESECVWVAGGESESNNFTRKINSKERRQLRNFSFIKKIVRESRAK